MKSAKYRIDTMVGEESGTTVEVKPKGSLYWEEDPSPSWNWDANDYRLKGRDEVIEGWGVFNTSLGKLAGPSYDNETDAREIVKTGGSGYEVVKVYICRADKKMVLAEDTLLIDPLPLAGIEPPVKPRVKRKRKCKSPSLNARKMWSSHDEQFVRDNFGMMSYPVMGTHLGRTAQAVYLRAKGMGFETGRKA